MGEWKDLLHRCKSDGVIIPERKSLILCKLRFEVKRGVTFRSSKRHLSPIETASFARADVIFHYIGDIPLTRKDYLNNPKVVS